MRNQKIDYTLFVTVLALLTLGVIMIYSASAFMAHIRWNQSSLFLKKQLLWFILAIIIILTISRINYHHWQKLAWPIMIFALVALALVFSQRDINGARRWIFLFGNSFQPAEYFKYAAIIFSGYYLCRKPTMLTCLREMIWPWGLISLCGVALILFQPDLGMALVIITTLFTLLYMAGLKYRFVLLAFLVPVLMVVLMVLGFNYKPQRLTTFVESSGTAGKETYQVSQSVLAIGSCGFFGKGIGRGSAKLLHLPESHTDFIIANVAEEGGFFMVAICLVLYFLVIVRGLRIASLAQDQYGFFLAFGIVALLAINIIVNIGVATRLLPTTGMPLPFLSYGGSSIICSAFGIGVLLNLSRHQCAVSRMFERHKA